MELSSVWFAGASSLYSQEFYALTRARLAPGGVLQQWVQLHHLRRRELAVIVHTLRSSFPHVALFVGGAQGVLVASDAPLLASAARLAELEQRPSIQRTQSFAHMTDLFDDLVTSEADLDRSTSTPPPTTAIPCPSPPTTTSTWSTRRPRATCSTTTPR